MRPELQEEAASRRCDLLRDLKILNPAPNNPSALLQDEVKAFGLYKDGGAVDSSGFSKGRAGADDLPIVAKKLLQRGRNGLPFCCGSFLSPERRAGQERCSDE